MRVMAVVLVGLVLVVAWRLGVLGVLVAVLVWVWLIAPVPMTVLYAAGALGFGACVAYPRYRPGVAWSDVVMRSPRVPRLRVVSGAAWDGQVSEYLARLRCEQDRAVA